MRERFQKLIEQLNAGLYERQEAVKLALLAAISGESIFFLGPPGVAKSLIARRLSKIFESGKSFEYLMNRFSTPEEIFGPISVSKLKNEDKYERIVDKYLPSADIAFLDEIWKAGPSIQNTLLTIINEKVFRNGQQEIKVPLKCLIAASNELPAKGEGLEALWDRFLIRYIVTNISNPLNFSYFLQSEINDNEFDLPEELKISEKEYNSWQKSISAIDLPEEVIDIINILKYNISEYNKNTENPIYVSDRRWKKIVKVLKTSAFINGRNYVDLSDLFLVVYMIWSEVEHIDIVKEMIVRIIKNHGYLTVPRKIEKTIKLLFDEVSDQGIKIIKKKIIKPKLVTLNNILLYRGLCLTTNKNYKHLLIKFYEIDDKSNSLNGYKYIPVIFNNKIIDPIQKGLYRNMNLFNNTRLISTDIEFLGNYKVKIFKNSFYFNFPSEYKIFKLKTVETIEEKTIKQNKINSALNNYKKEYFNNQITLINSQIKNKIKEYNRIKKNFSLNIFIPDSLVNLYKMNLSEAIKLLSSTQNKLMKYEQ